MIFRAPQNYIFIGEKNIFYASVKKNKKNKFKIEKKLQREIPQGILSSGKIVRKNQFIDFIKRINKKFNMKGGSVKFILPDNLVGNKFFQVPAMSKSGINDYLEVEAERISDFSLNETVVDYSIVGKDEKNINLHLATVEKDLIIDYQEVIWKTFKKCQGITFRADATWPVLSQICGNEKIILLELHENITYISAASRNQTYLYWQNFQTINTLERMQQTIKEVDKYLEQEMNLEIIKKIYIWDTRKKKIEFPQLNAGHNWINLNLDDLNLSLDKSFIEFYNLNTDYFLPLLGMIIRDL